MFYKIIPVFFAVFYCWLSAAQETGTLRGTVTSSGTPLAFANVLVSGLQKGAVTDESGLFSIPELPAGKHTVVVSYTGFRPQTKAFTLTAGQELSLTFDLEENSSLDEVVVTGTLKPVSRLESPVPVEVYKPAFFQKNPTPNIFEALQNVNGVRPQLNCNVCNTGDIHINGLEGPYTLVLIDGMPIVSGLSTVYGLSGIPNSLLERIEIVKGPASSLYGSEAVGGLINIITKNPQNAPGFSADSYATGWGEVNVDLGVKAALGKKAALLLGANYYNYSNPLDKNNDNFTDVTLQDRISVFQKWNFQRNENRLFSLAGRFFYEDRWGGEMQWNKNFRGGSEVYGESIYTRRWELLGSYQLPVKEKMLLSVSYTDHDQNSVYGAIPYLARQRIGFGQLSWDKQPEHHDLLFGAALRYQYYDDNTPATSEEDGNAPDRIWIPGIFAQDEIQLSEKHKLLLGVRYDHDSRHGAIFTPRLAYKWSISDTDIIRLNAGTGFRVVNLFAEEHAALTGAREVVLEEALEPERSYNINLNYLKKLYGSNGMFIGLDASAWYTYFTNMILPDYDTDPDRIIYGNLDGHAVTTGISANLDVNFGHALKVVLGVTAMDVSNTENGVRSRQILTERFTGTWAVTCNWHAAGLEMDYTGNLYGPMRLPLLGDLDPRREYSPVWSIQNIKLAYKKIKNVEMYGGVKNLLNWTPNRGNPFLIARADDPFDKHVVYDENGQVQPTPDNPYALTFDPSYVYAPNQGIRVFLGFRITLD